MQDSLEDSIAQAGKHDEFSAAYDNFVNSRRTRNDQLDFYDTLVRLGASDEEADELVNLAMES